MSHMRKVTVFLVMALGSLLVAGGLCFGAEKATAKPTINLRLGDVVQPTHPMNVAAEKFAKKVADKTNGRIKITIFPARQLGDDRQLFEQVQQGALDMGEISAAPMGSTTPLMSALQLPFLFTSWDQYTKVMKSEATANLLKGLEKNGIKGLAVYNAGFRHFVSIAKPIKKPEDLKGLKFRVAETPLHLDIFRALNASPTPMPYGEIYSSLQNKVIDGLEMDLSAIQMEKHYEVAKYVTLSRHFTWPAVLMMNLAKFNALSPEDQKIIADSAKEVISENVKDITDIESKAVAYLKTKNVKIVELTPAELAPFIEATKNIEQKYAAQDPLIAEFVKYARSVK
ncbi:MAG: TRAP transporter substrate-binding protein [Deltaproteobacteria bacterium]|nr:TRAP transporter substrate-binding protein [Deltaproteobacteria bacterium]